MPPRLRAAPSLRGLPDIRTSSLACGEKNKRGRPCRRESRETNNGAFLLGCRDKGIMGEWEGLQARPLPGSPYPDCH